MGICKAIQYGNFYISVEIFPFRGNFIIDPLWELYYQSFMGTLLQSFGEILLYTCTEINEPCQLHWQELKYLFFAILCPLATGRI